MRTGYISIKKIMDDLLAHPLLTDLSLERAVNYAVEFMNIVGIPQSFEEKLEELEVKDYRALLPCDYYRVIQVRDSCSGIIRATTNSFHTDQHKNNNLYRTYDIRGRIIYTSFKEGKIEFAYLAIPVDSDGFPLIPENSSYTKALELYIKKQWFTILFDMGKITHQVLQNTQQEYSWSVGQCKADMIMPTIDEMENIANVWNSLIIKDNEHSRGFITSGSPNNIKIH